MNTEPTTNPQEVEGWDFPEPYVLSVTVTQADVDELGHANNAVYVRWMDRAAFAHSRAMGWSAEDYHRLGAAFVVRQHRIDYLTPAFLGQQLEVGTWAGLSGKASAVRHYQIQRPADGACLLRAVTRWAFVDLASLQPKRIPPSLREAFKPSAEVSRSTGSSGDVGSP
jgi:acyl-CoA thioester hydrolase